MNNAPETTTIETDAGSGRPKRPAVTTAIIIAAGLAAGLALTRPGPSNPAPAPAPESTAGAAAPAQPAPQGAYGDSNGAQAPAPAPAAPAAPAEIAIQDFAFSPGTVVAPGGQINVANRDSAPHTLTFNDGSVDTGTLDGGAATTVTAPSAPGTYSFFCAIHPSMTGQLTVAG